MYNRIRDTLRQSHLTRERLADTVLNLIPADTHELNFVILM